MSDIMSKLHDLEEQGQHPFKMNNYVVHMTECKPESTIASAKVARFISTQLNIPLVDCMETAVEIDTIDRLIIVNGPMAFCDFLPELAELVRIAKEVIWVQQDYTIMPPKADSEAESPFRKVFADRKLRPTFWTTCHENIRPGSKDKYINWNQLTYNLKPLHVATENRVLYYGAFREKRLQSFVRYFKDPAYPLAISTTTIRAKKFRALGTGEVFVPPFANVISGASRYAAALYIEDEKSHKAFHSPANRFYEMLSAGVPIFFDYECDVQLSNAGIHVPSAWKVSDNKDLAYKFAHTDLCEMRRAQRELWAKDYITDLSNQLMKAWNDK